MNLWNLWNLWFTKFTYHKFSRKRCTPMHPLATPWPPQWSHRHSRTPLSAGYAATSWHGLPDVDSLQLVCRNLKSLHMQRNFEQMPIKAGKVLKLWVFKHPSLVGNVHRVGMLKHWCVPSDFSCQPQNTHLPSIVNSKGTGTSHPAPGPRPVGAPSNHCQFWRSLFRAKKTHKWFEICSKHLKTHLLSTLVAYAFLARITVFGLGSTDPFLEDLALKGTQQRWNLNSQTRVPGVARCLKKAVHLAVAVSW